MMINETDADYIGYNVQNALGHVTYEITQGFFGRICIQFVDTEYAWLGDTQTKDRDTAIATINNDGNGSIEIDWYHRPSNEWRYNDSDPYKGRPSERINDTNMMSNDDIVSELINRLGVYF